MRKQALPPIASRPDLSTMRKDKATADAPKTQMNRADRRRMGARAPQEGPTGRAPTKTGSADHWVHQERKRADIRKALEKVPTRNLVPECPEIAKVAEAFPNVHLLQQAEYRLLIDLPGVGPATLRKIKKYLASRNVWTVWQVQA